MSLSRYTHVNFSDTGYNRSQLYLKREVIPPSFLEIVFVSIPFIKMFNKILGCKGDLTVISVTPLTARLLLLMWLVNWASSTLLLHSFSSLLKLYMRLNRKRMASPDRGGLFFSHQYLGIWYMGSCVLLFFPLVEAPNKL